MVRGRCRIRFNHVCLNGSHAKFSNRLVAQKAKTFGGDSTRPSIAPLAIAWKFLVITGIIVDLAKFKFLNETLVIATVPPNDCRIQ
jgi:hypothetical protein